MTVVGMTAATMTVRGTSTARWLQLLLLQAQLLLLRLMQAQLPQLRLLLAAALTYVERGVKRPMSNVMLNAMSICRT